MADVPQRSTKGDGGCLRSSTSGWGQGSGCRKSDLRRFLRGMKAVCTQL